MDGYTGPMAEVASINSAVTISEGNCIVKLGREDMRKIFAVNCI